MFQIKFPVLRLIFAYYITESGEITSIHKLHINLLKLFTIKYTINYLELYAKRFNIKDKQKVTSICLLHFD